MPLLKEQTETFFTAYKEANAHKIAESISLDANDVLLKIFASSPELLAMLRDKVPGGDVIPIHHDEKQLETFKKHLPGISAGITDEKFIHPSWKKIKQPSVILFAFTLALVDAHTGLYTACRILRESSVDTARIVSLQWKKEFMQKHDELRDIPFISMDEYETISYELGLQDMTVTEHEDFFTARMDFPKIQFQEDWRSFAGDA